MGRVRGALRAPLQPAVVAAEPGRGADGLVDLAALRRALGSPEYANHPMLLSFSACSNVTDVQTDTRTIARLPARALPPLPVAARAEQQHADELAIVTRESER